MKLIVAKEHTMTCPYCQYSLESHKVEEESVKSSYPNKSVFSDGDSIPFNLHEFDYRLSWKTIDNSLLFGTCPSCKENFYLVEAKLASKPIGDSDYLDYWDTDIVREGKVSLFLSDSDYPHFIISNKDCKIKHFDSNLTTTLDIEHHYAGPFRLDETILGEYGVSHHHGKNTWENGSSVLKDILSKRIDFLPKLFEERKFVLRMEKGYTEDDKRTLEEKGYHILSFSIENPHAPFLIVSNLNGSLEELNEFPFIKNARCYVNEVKPL